jgi:hypothetical protein
MDMIGTIENNIVVIYEIKHMKSLYNLISRIFRANYHFKFRANYNFIF